MTAIRAPAEGAEAAVMRAFAAAGVTPGRAEIWGLVYLAELIAADPHDMTHGDDHSRLRAAVREIQEAGPRLLAAAEREAAAAGLAGRASHSLRFAELLRDLLAAAEPFRGVAGPRRDARGWWHGWAWSAWVDVAAVMRAHHRPAGHGKNSPAVVVAAAVLRAAGAPVNAEGVAAVLRAPR